MLDLGDRVWAVADLMTDEGDLLYAGRKGMVVGRQGPKVVVAWDQNGYAAEYSTASESELALANRAQAGQRGTAVRS